MTFVVIEMGAPQLSIVVFNQRRLSLGHLPDNHYSNEARAQRVRPRLLVSLLNGGRNTTPHCLAEFKETEAK